MLNELLHWKMDIMHYEMDIEYDLLIVLVPYFVIGFPQEEFLFEELSSQLLSFSSGSVGFVECLYRLFNIMNK